MIQIIIYGGRKGRINMGFWFFMLICDLLIPAILMIAGRMMWKTLVEIRIYITDSFFFNPHSILWKQ